MRHKRIRSILLCAVVGVLLPAAPSIASGDGAGPNLFTGDLGNIIWSLITFGMVVLVLGKFAWGPILGALKKREDFIRDSLQQAKKDREAAEASLADLTARLEKARTEASAIVEEGRRDADVLRRKIEEDAKEQAGVIVERARKEVGLATETAVKQLYDLSAKLATGVAARILEKEVDAAQHERLISESIDALSRVEQN